MGFCSFVFTSLKKGENELLHKLKLITSYSWSLLTNQGSFTEQLKLIFVASASLIILEIHSVISRSMRNLVIFIMLYVMTTPDPAYHFLE